MLPKSYPQKKLFKMSVPNFYVRKRSKNHDWKCPYWTAAQSLSAKTVVRNVPIELPAEIASVKTTIKMTVLKVCPETLSSKTVVQIVCNEMLAWEPFEKTTNKNDRTEMLSNNLSAKPIVQNVRPKMLAEKASEKLSPKMTVLKCCLKIFRENSHSKCPYRNFSWTSVRKTITGKDRTGMLPKMYPQKQSFKISLPDC